MIKVRLISGPTNIDRKLSIMWQASKTSNAIDYDPPVDITLLGRLLHEDVPIVRHFYFTFLLENMTISFREQLVRSQYDHYWIQSGRITNWDTAYFELPACTKDNNRLKCLANNAINSIHAFVHACTHEKINPEDYRDLIPCGAHHRGIWTANLQSLATRFKKRTCWIAQNDKWFPVLYQVSEELRAYHPALINLAIPPCRDINWNWCDCPMHETMLDRYEGTDPLPVCPAWAAANNKTNVHDILVANRSRVSQFERMWGHDITTGRPKR
ncbi:MAG: FAD-dependent thymidylate synthase [Magnetococcus sp. WYHC-3]